MPGNVGVQQLASGGYDFYDAYFKQTLFWFAMAAMIGQTVCASQHNRLRPKRAVARGICRPKNRHDRNFERCRQMHWTGIASDENMGPASERNQLRNGTPNASRRSGACLFNRRRQSLFSGPVIYKRSQSISSELFGDFSVAFCGPSLRAPSGSGIKDCEFLQVAQESGDRTLGVRINRKV
jgi:hypothetical protein